MVGKWLAATTVYALLWIPTLAYLGVVAAFRGDGGGWDLAQHRVRLRGRDRDRRGAARVGGRRERRDLDDARRRRTRVRAAGRVVPRRRAARAVRPSSRPIIRRSRPCSTTIGLRVRLTAFARGEIDLAARARRRDDRGRPGCRSRSCSRARAGGARRSCASGTLATANLAAIGALAIVLAVRHPHAWDVSAHPQLARSGDHRGARRAAGAGDAHDRRADATARSSRCTTRSRASPSGCAAPAASTVRRVDPAALPGGLDAAARVAGPPAEGSRLERRRRRRARRPAPRRRRVRARDDRGRRAGRADVRAPRDRASARRHARRARRRRCRSPRARPPVTASSRSRPSIRRAPTGPRSATACAATASTTTEVTTSFAHCTVVIVAGPIRAARRRGGARGPALRRAAVAGCSSPRPGRPVPNGPSLAATGLEGVLAADGPRPAVRDRDRSDARDPRAARRADDRERLQRRTRSTPGSPTSAVRCGSSRARSPSRAARSRWSRRPRRAGASSTLDAPPAKDERDLAGPIVLAAAGATHRVVAIGSAESFTNAALTGGASAGDLWLEHAVRWLATKPAPALASRRARRIRSAS